MLKKLKYCALMAVILLFATPDSFAYTEIMCSEDENCMQCRQDLDCQECYFSCANKYGVIEGDVKFAYRLEYTQLRALKCYKSCWGEELEIEIRENKKHQTNRSFHKNREVAPK